MSLEAPKTQTSEHTLHTAGEIATTFEAAYKSILTLTCYPNFHKQCLEQGIDPYGDIDTQDYWNNFEDFVSDRVTDMRSTQGNTLSMSTLELLAATPAYLYSQTALNHPTQMSAENRDDDRHMTSFFNSLVRNFAIEFPSTAASTLVESLEKMASAAIEDKQVLQEASWLLRETIRGAQHELAFGQILEHTGRNFQPAGLEEDLRGIDYVVAGNHSRELYIDVKASLSEIQSPHNQSSAFAVSKEGKITMFSLTKDSELHNKFFTTDEIAAQKAPVLDRLLDQAESSYKTA